MLDAFARPVLHHRTAAFSELFKDMLEKAGWLFNTAQPVLPIHSTGRGAMEASIANLFSAGDEIICLCNGKFANMFATIAGRYGVIAHKVCEDWEKAPALEELEEAVKAYPNAKAVTICHNESSSAVTLDIRQMADIAHAHDMLLIVDAVSSVGCIQIDFDACGADVLVTASQKGMMCLTGLALAVLSDRAWAACETATLPKYYTNFKDIRKCVLAERPETPGSTPVTAIYGMREALTMMQEEGREELFQRHARVARAIRASLRALGFSLFPAVLPEEMRSNSLTAFTCMEGLSANEFKNALSTQYGLNIAGGIDHLKGRVLRIGHMGHFYDRDAITLVACMEAVLAQRGLLEKPGTALAACLEELSR